MDRRLTHVFFDVTHTLLDVRGSVGEIYARCAARHGLQVEPGSVERSFQEAIAGIPQPVAPGLAEAEIQARERGWWHEVARRSLAPFGPFPDFEAFFAEVFEAFRHRDAWVLLPGVAEALRLFRTRGLRLGIISDIDSRLFDVLAAFGLEATFDVVCLSFRCGYQKPDVRLFHAALGLASVPAAQAAHVGDSLRSDVQGALGAGMHAIHLDTTRDGGAPSGAHVVHRWSDLPALLERLGR